MSKYSNKKTNYGGYSFASQGERDCYQMLILMEKAGEIDFIQAQCKVHLLPGINYIADFKIFDKKLKEFVWVEYKGFETEVWRIKKKIYAVHGAGRLRIYKGYGLRITLVEELIPRKLTELTYTERKED